MFRRICSIYDRSFITNLALVYINGGLFQSLNNVALRAIFKTTYHFNPTQLQVQMAFNILPWDFKLFYGIIADTVVLPCFKKESRKGWIIIFSLVVLVCMLFVLLMEIESSRIFGIIFFTVSISTAFMDTTIDAITCV